MSKSLKEHFPRPADLVELPADALGMLLLSWFAETGESIDRTTWTNVSWLQGAMGAGPEEMHLVATVMAEALGWLESHGLIARAPAGRPDTELFLTRRGRAVAEDEDGLAAMRAVDRALFELHPELGAVRPQLMLGEYDNAVFVAMRSVEDRVRRLGELPREMVGKDLVTQAFNKAGRLRFPPDTAGEAEGVMHLFQGAMQAFKNPTSHRVLAFDDPELASEVVVLANLLHRLLDRVEAHLAQRYAEAGGIPPWSELA